MDITKKIYYRGLIEAWEKANGWGNQDVTRLLLTYARRKWDLADCVRSIRGKHTIIKAYKHYEQQKFRHQYGWINSR